MKSLNLAFTGSLGKSHSLKLAYANDELTTDTIKSAMYQLAEMNMFTSAGENIYATPVSAKYVETITTPIFSTPKVTA